MLNTYAKEDIYYRKISGSIPGRNSKFGDDHLVYVASGITSSRITQSCGLTSLPTGNRAPSGAVIFSRVSVFVTKKHSTIILRKIIVECFLVGEAHLDVGLID